MESIDKIKRLADIVSKNTAPGSNTNTLIGNLLKAMALYMAEQHHGAVGGYQFLISIDNLPTGDLTDKQKRTGYVVGENIYFYVGTGGDTLDGEYQNGGSFHGTKGDDGLSAYEIWREIEGNENKTIDDFWAFLTADKGYIKQAVTYAEFQLLDPTTVSNSTIYVYPNSAGTEYYAVVSNGNIWVELLRNNGDITDLVNKVKDLAFSVSSIKYILKRKADLFDTEEDGVFFVNEKGEVFIRYNIQGFDVNKVSEHFKELVKPDLSDYAKKEDIPEQKTVIGDTEEDGIFFSDNEGHVFLKYDNEDGLDANKVSEHLKGLIAPNSASGSDIMKDTDENGAFFAGKDGNVFAKYDNENGFDVNKISEHFVGMLNKRSIPTVQGYATTMSDGSTINLNNIPDCKFNQVISFFGFVANGNAIGTLIINRGSDDNYSSTKVEIDNASVNVTQGTNEPITYSHGLNIKDFVIININVGLYVASLTITTNDTSHQNGFSQEIPWKGCRNGLSVRLSGIDAYMRDCALSWGSADLLKPLWCFGDSYFDYWPKIAIQAGYGNAMFDAYSGRGSYSASVSFDNCLNLATPKAVFWCLGANNPDTYEDDGTPNGLTCTAPKLWLDAYEHVKEVCAKKGIELVLYTIHNGISNNSLRLGLAKNEIIKNSGYRYIDVYSICKDPDKQINGKDANGRYVTDWFDGMVSSDNVHPSSFGAIVIARFVVTHLPELKD